jgi:acetyltransferase
MVGAAGPVLDEYESKRVLAEYGIPIVGERVVHSPEEALEAAAALGYPVAVKVLSPDVPHKTDANALVLNVATPEHLRVAYADVLANVRGFRRDARLSGVLIQQMASGGVEVILGVSRDPHVGPVVMFGMGGILIEVFEDVAFRALPIGRADAVEMIAETKAARLLQGHRGRPAADTDALVETLLRVSQMASDLGEDLLELDINPLIVGPAGTGVRVVDALLVRSRD